MLDIHYYIGKASTHAAEDMVPFRLFYVAFLDDLARKAGAKSLEAMRVAIEEEMGEDLWRHVYRKFILEHIEDGKIVITDGSIEKSGVLYDVCRELKGVKKQVSIHIQMPVEKDVLRMWEVVASLYGGWNLVLHETSKSVKDADT